MARIEKIQLQGVRSFGPLESDRQNVEFFSPLTLILGQNGCGKTTIIECLKFVTTGDTPPGTNRGSSFVHDPKMAKESTVRGQVKLLFRSVAGHQKIICRSLEATQKVKNISTKTMDTTITTRSDGTKNQNVSSKCTDVNAEMFMSLGVTKPILNYVIFCHQEDSNWPLEEGKKVKEKFDEIFNSAKYRTCLNNIKDVRKQEMDEMKLQGMNMSHYKEDKELCRDKKGELKKKIKELKMTEAEMEQMKETLRPLEDQVRECLEEEKGYSHLQSKITEANTKLECSKRERKQLEKEICEVFAESMTEAEMEEKIENVDMSGEENKEKVDQLKKQIEVYKQREKNLEFKLQKNAASLGQLISDKSKHDKDIEERKSLLEKAEEDLAVSIDSESFGEVLKREEEKICNQIKRFKAIKTEEEEKLNDSLDKLKQERATLEEKKKRGQSDLMETKAQIAKIKREMSELDGAGNLLQKLKEEWEVKNDELKKAKEKFDLESLQDNIKSKKTKVVDLEKHEEQLKEELSALEEKQHTLQQIEYLNSDIRAKEEKRQKIANKRNSVFLDLFQTVPDFKRLKSVFKGEQEKNDKLLKEIEAEKQKEETQITLKIEQMAQTKKERAKRMKKERDLQAKVSDVLVGDEDLENELVKAKDRLDESRKELQCKEAGKFTYRDFLDRMSKMKEPVCPTCNRGFHAKSEAEELIKDLEAMIAEIPRKLQGLEKKVDLEEKRYHELQKISPDFYALKQVTEEIAEMSARVSSIEKEVRQLKEKKEEKELEWSKALEESEVLKSVSEDVQMIDTITRELSGMEERRDDLQLTCPILEDGRSLEMLRKEEKETSAQLRQIRKACDAEQDLFNSQSKLINDLEASCNKLTNKKLEIEGKQQQRANMLEKKGELENKVGTIQKEIEANIEDLKPMKEKLEAKEAEKVEIQRQKELELVRFNNREKAVERMKRDLDKLDQDILQYQESNKGRNLEEAKQKKLEFEKDLASIREEKVLDEEDMRKLEVDIAAIESTKRNLRDNLQLRKLRKNEVCQMAQVEKYQSKLDNTDFVTVENKKKMLLHRINDINAEINSKSGKLSEMKRTLSEIERELRNPKLKNAARLHYEAVVKHRTLKMAVDDLNKFYSALDFAIMRFHKEKMKVVNSIIREMWRATYRGNDIDYIEIKTDDGEVSVSADKRRTYNYRVVMVKNDVEMDMRGRCSAGQKVLASLIIRLALAETFAENCGIIALDEPTTNLDRENIESLAFALTNIATRQSENREFQLVVITHDEEFIDQLSKCDRIQYYQKVSRNARGISEIRKINVNKLDQSSQAY